MAIQKPTCVQDKIDHCDTLIINSDCQEWLISIITLDSLSACLEIKRLKCIYILKCMYMWKACVHRLERGPGEKKALKEGARDALGRN